MFDGFVTLLSNRIEEVRLAIILDHDGSFGSSKPALRGGGCDKIHTFVFVVHSCGSSKLTISGESVGQILAFSVANCGCLSYLIVPRL